MMAAGLISVVPFTPAESDDARLRDSSIAQAEAVEGITDIEAVSVHLGHDDELWLGDFPTAPGDAFTSQAGRASDFSDDGNVAPQRSNIFDQADNAHVQAQVLIPEISEQTEQLQRVGPFAGSGDQSLSVPALQLQGNALATESVADTVANALEGRMVDLDALLGTEPVQPQFVLQSGMTDQFLGGDFGMAPTSYLFSIDLSQQQAMAQLEHAAATGHL